MIGIRRLYYFLVPLLMAAGCASPSATRPAAAGLDLGPVQSGLANLSAQLCAAADVQVATDAKVEALAAAVADVSTRLVDVQQHAAVAYSKIDQSQSDKWVNRGLVAVVGAGMLIAAVAQRRAKKN